MNSLFRILHRFSPGIGNESVPSSGPMKRRTQSLSALPKDGDRKVDSSLQSTFDGQLADVTSTAHLLSSSDYHTEGERPYPPSNECVHDLQQTPPRPGSSATSKPGQPDSQQDSGGVVVRFGAQWQTAVPRSCLPGQDSSHQMVSFSLNFFSVLILI